MCQSNSLLRNGTSIVFNNKINKLPFPIKYKHIKDYKPVNIYILKHKTNNNLFIVDYTIQSLEEAIKIIKYDVNNTNWIVDKNINLIRNNGGFKDWFLFDFSIKAIRQVEEQI